MLSEKEKAERYTLIMGYFEEKLQKRADNLAGEMIYYDGWKKPKYMDETERQESVANTFINEMDNIGFWEFAELVAHEFCGENIGENNQFHDLVYGE